MSTIKERIQRIMTDSGLTQQDFARRLGVSPASISSIFSGRTNPTLNHVEAIRRAFPQINTDWLMFGSGTMYRTDDGGSSAPLPSPADNEGVQPSLSSSADGSAAQQLQHATEEPVPTGEALGEKHGFRSSPTLSEQRLTAPSAMGINIDNRGRVIQEIRVFYSDGTFEAFVPANR